MADGGLLSGRLPTRMLISSRLATRSSTRSPKVDGKGRFRVTAGKVDDGRAKVLSAKVGRGGKANIAAQDALFLRQQRLGVARLLQYAPRGMIKSSPRWSGVIARGAMEQAGLVTLFHRLQAGRR